MKKFKLILLIFILMPCLFIINGCSFLKEPNIYVTDIIQTEVVGDKTTYTVYYSNGETSLLTINNGKDGDDGDDLTIQSIKEYCESEHIDFNQFLQKYLTVVQKNQTIQDATNIALQSTVTVWCEFPTSDYYNNKKVSIACGAGVIYKMEEEFSYIITNYHVVYYAECDTSNGIANKIHLYQYGKQEGYTKTSQKENGYPVIKFYEGAVDAEFIGGSLNYDIAVLKVKTDDLKANNEHVAPVAVADEYSISETAIAIGNPEGDGFSVTSGIISVESEQITMTGADDITECEFRVMRIDTAVNGGNSGGGLFNINGELIGIVNAKAISSDIDNIAYAIPYDNATKVADNIIHYHNQSKTIVQVKMLILDIKYNIENSRAIYDPTTNRATIQNDLKVVSVTSGGVGNLIGLQANDIIKSISINGKVYETLRDYQFLDLLLTIRAGDKIIITVKRGETTKELGITTEAGVLDNHLTVVI